MGQFLHISQTNYLICLDEDSIFFDRPCPDSINRAYISTVGVIVFSPAAVPAEFLARKVSTADRRSARRGLQEESGAELERRLRRPIRDGVARRIGRCAISSPALCSARRMS
jgi:hypothetical protein